MKSIEKSCVHNLKTKHFIGNGEINICETEVNVLNDE